MQNLLSNIIPQGSVEQTATQPEDTINSITYSDGKVIVIYYSSGIEKEFSYNDQGQLSSIEADGTTIKTFNYNEDGTLSSTTLGD